MISAIIVDDEETGANVLKLLLDTYFTEVNIQAVCTGIAEAETEIRRQKPDILFLDIHMPSGDGFKLLERLGRIHFALIFVTAHNQYAIKALKLSATDYLLKPVNRHDLKFALDKSMQLKDFYELHGNDCTPVFNNLAKNSSDKVLVLNKYKNETILLKDIVCVTADSNYSCIHTVHKLKISATKPLKEFDDMLCSENMQFLRIHKSVIINTSMITATQVKKEIMMIILKNGHQFEVSRRKRTWVTDALEKLAFI